ncbi:uncharacterized protein isoform X2 [Musca autumnalis]|uniref:uncharacterized protein isoform X2 n=1 Tax=Musca autumnalis TaxID=221902 RepID=UPI003CED74A1
MSESFCIKTEPIDKDYEQEDTNNDANTLCYNTIKLENFTNMVNDIKKEELVLDKVKEESTIDIIKEEDVDEMDELLQQHLTSTITQHISLPKLEIMDVYTDEDDCKGPEINGDTDANASDNKKSSREDSTVLNKKVIKNTEKSDISSSRLAQTPTEHKCELCGKSYTEHAKLRRHMLYTHILYMDTKYICKLCNQRFTTQAGLKRHSNTTHSEAQTLNEHKCEVCGKFYTEHANLLRHMRQKHPSSLDTEYICEICNQRFTTHIGLHRHSYTIHSVAQKPTKHKCEICDLKYICEICNQGFTTHPGLTIHTLRMHPKAQTQKALNTDSNKTHPVAQTPTKHKCEI